MRTWHPAALVAVTLALGCGPGPAPDAGPVDGGPTDDAGMDAGPPDAGPPDAGPPDAGPLDAGPPDAGVDAGPIDAGPSDAGPPRPLTGLAFDTIAHDGDAFTSVAVLPGRPDELLLAQHTGEILHVRVVGDTATRLGTIEVPDVAVDRDCGLLSVAADPMWATNGFVYAGTCAGDDLHTRVTRLTFDGVEHDVADSAAIVIEVGDEPGPYPFVHAIGNFLFEPDGTMVFGVGDKSTRAAGQDPTSRRSTLLRIVPNREPDGSGHTPAPGNPFADGAAGHPAVWAYGFRFPWRIARDSRGWLYVGDVGEGRREEIDVVTSPGTNFGWPTCEGPCASPDAELVDPLLSWPHSDDHPYVDDDPETLPTTRRVVWVAPIRPPRSDDPFIGIDDELYYGDTCAGWVRGVALDGDAEVASDRYLGHLPYVTGWAWGSDGTGWVTTYGSCDSGVTFEPAGLYRVVFERE